MKKLLSNKIRFFIFSQIQYLDTGIFVSPVIKKMHSFIKHPLISSSTIILFGAQLGNVSNFLFNLFMSRNLSLADYGILASFFSLTALFALPVGAVIPTFTYFFALYFAKNDFVMLRGLYIKVTKYSFLIGLCVLIAFFIFRTPISNFFNIKNDSFIVLAGFGTFITFLSVANQPLLQAKLAFAFLSFLTLFSSLLKLTVGILFVFLGYSIFGVLFVLVISSLIPYFLTFFSLKFLFHREIRNPKISLGKLFSYGLPATIAIFGLTSLITLDIILVKHFFSPDLAGIYAILSLVGKIIYYLTAPIATVMFPLVVQKYTKGEDFRKDFFLALSLVIIPSILLIIFYSLYPDFVINFFKKDLDPSFITLIIPFGVIAALFGVLSVMVNFYLAIDKTKVFIPIIIATIMQIILIVVFHESLLQIIVISLMCMSLLLFVLLLYYVKLYAERLRHH